MNDYYYLTVIYQLETPNFGDVANALHLTKPSISAMVQRLMKNGLVSKIQSERR
nr:MarR family transcriptional regulator [Clostridium kluyveri]